MLQGSAGCAAAMSRMKPSWRAEASLILSPECWALPCDRHPITRVLPVQEAATKELLMNAKRNLKDYKAVVVAQLAGASPLTVVPAG